MNEALIRRVADRGCHIIDRHGDSVSFSTRAQAVIAAQVWGTTAWANNAHLPPELMYNDLLT